MISEEIGGRPIATMKRFSGSINAFENCVS
jgi:hypothetical protein